MSIQSPSLDEELARWRQLSKGAIGNKVALLVVFLTTTPVELREQIREAIMCGNDFKTY
jgi:hypothetical protein